MADNEKEVKTLFEDQETTNPAETEEKPKKTKKGEKPQRHFPTVALEEALEVPKKIKELNAGNPWATDEVAKAIGIAKATNKFFYLTAASRDYGLTIGTRNTKQIEIAPIGRSVVYASSPQDEALTIEKAFFNVPLFKSVFEYYKGSELPDIKYLRNTLESQFGIPPEYVEEFYTLYDKNCKFLNKVGANEAIIPHKSKLEEFTSEDSIVLGQPSKESELIAFVIMPFVEKTGKYSGGFFREVLNSLITPAAVEAGFKVRTAKKEGSDIIHSTIINELLDADLVIADLTEHNPNVLFELGMRMAFDKPIALIRSEGTPAIFDVDNMLRVYDYNPSLWQSTIKKDVPELIKHIAAAWKNRDAEVTYLKILKRPLK